MSVQPYEVPRGAVIVGGKAWPCSSETTLWTDSGLAFREGRGGRKRELPVDLVVWHHTAGNGNAQRVHRVLNERSLGVDFIIDADGMIWQCSDPVNVCTYHAGIANGRSVGIEIVGRGVPSSDDEPHYVARVHGRRIKFLSFLSPQFKAAWLA
jgi:N-acetyl-anhydromuramyl-L-alanine amidase AmpD